MAKTSGDQTVAETTTTGGTRAPTTVQLNGQPSQDATTYSWSQDPNDDVSIRVTLSDAAAVKPTFIAPNVGPNGATLHFTLTVTGCTSPVQSKSVTTTVNVTNVNGPPLAAITVSPPSAVVNDAEQFTLDGNGSTDPDADALTYRWYRLVGGMPVEQVGTAAAVTLNAPLAPYPDGLSVTYRLTVSDGTLSSSKDQVVTVKWVNHPPTARATCSSTVDEGKSVLLDGADLSNASSDPDDGIASYAWRQVFGGPDANLGPDALSSAAFDFNAPALTAGKGDTMGFELKVSDNGGLYATAQCSVVVHDVTAPTLSVSGTTAEAESKDGAAVSFSVTATDAFDGDEPANSSVSCDSAPGTTFPLGDTTVKCSAHDKAGNVGMASFKVSVTDTTPPVVTVPDDVTKEATGPSGAVVSFSATATDLVDGAVTPVCTPASDNAFALGVTTVRCNANDAHGNHAQEKTFTVTVRDTTPPTLTVPANTTAEATGPSGAVVNFSATATDLVDGSVTPVCTPASGSTFALGSTMVSCTATDAHSNGSAPKTFTVTVQDTTPPAVTVPANITAEATGPSGAAVTFTATATDLVDGSVTPVCTPESGSTFALDVITTVSCTATDAHTNASTKTFTVKVVDTTPPTVTPPAAVTTGPTNATGAKVTFGPASATDLVDGAIALVTCAPASGSQFGFGTTKVTCSATDAHNNTGTNSFNVTVNPFTFIGFFQPVDNASTGLLNTVKNGSTVPVKFKVQGQGGLEITDTAAIKSAKAGEIPCSALANEPESAIDVVTTGGTVLRYDGTAQQFIFNWQTPKAVGKCYRLDVTLNDGKTVQSANFKLK